MIGWVHDFLSMLTFCMDTHWALKFFYYNISNSGKKARGIAISCVHYIHIMFRLCLKQIGGLHTSFLYIRFISKHFGLCAYSHIIVHVQVIEGQYCYANIYEHKPKAQYVSIGLCNFCMQRRSEIKFHAF